MSELAEKLDALIARATPKPWSVPHFAEPDMNCECGYVLTDCMMGAVATVHCSGEGDDWQKTGDHPKFLEATANARMIAAAPLLAAVARDADKLLTAFQGSFVHTVEQRVAFDKTAASLAAIAKEIDNG